MEEMIMSSPGDFSTFMKSSIYKDFINELDIRINELTELIIDEDLQASGRVYDQARGGIKNMRQMKTIFQDLMKNKIDDLNQGENE